jgi:hypothetical protein
MVGRFKPENYLYLTLIVIETAQMIIKRCAKVRKVHCLSFEQKA